MKFNVFTLEVDTKESIDPELNEKALAIINSLNPELGVTKVETKITKTKAIITYWRKFKYGVLGNNIVDYDLALAFDLNPDKFQVSLIGDSSRYCSLFYMFPWRDKHCYGDLKQAEKYYKRWLCNGAKSVSINPSDDKLTIIIK